MQVFKISVHYDFFVTVICVRCRVLRFMLAFAVKQLVQLLAQKRRAVVRKHVNVQSCVEGHVSRWPATVAAGRPFVP